MNLYKSAFSAISNNIFCISSIVRCSCLKNILTGSNGKKSFWQNTVFSGKNSFIVITLSRIDDHS